jgi:hypothetical protein
VNWRPKGITSLLGPLVVLLSYYYCRQCRRGYKPWDAMLGLTAQALTPAAAQIISQAGVLTSFGHASDETLRTMSGLRVSESTVERTTEEAGQRVSEQRARGEACGPATAWNWQRDARNHTCAYVSLDATGVRQQGPGAARADGRMAYVGMVYNPRSEHDATRPPPRQVRYLSGFLHLDDVGRGLRQMAEQVGVMNAEQQIALSDGGAGLEDVVKKFFPRAVCILDFWHAKEHLVELAQACWPEDEPARQSWLDTQCHRLKHEGGTAVLAMLESMDLSGQSEALREVHRRQVGYFRHHAHRMDYPTYVANGWQIGSGPVESACKTVVNNRLNGGGMRWGSNGANAICHLRAVYLSEPACWRTLWARPAPHAHLQN